MVFDGVAVHCVPGATDCLGAVVVELADVQATLARAVDCGHRIEGDAFHLAGVYFRVK